MQRNKTILFRIFFLAAILNTGIIFPQDFIVKNYSVMDGLPSSTVHGVAQDGAGRMWFATRNGISVYDGVVWKNYINKDGLGNNECLAVCSDKAGNIWGMSKANTIQLVCYTGDGFLLKRSQPFEVLNADFTNNKCFAVYADNKDTLAFVGSGRDGLFVYKNGNWRKITTSNGLPSNQIRDIKEIQGIFYVVTNNGIITFNKDLKIEIPFNQIPNEDISKLWSIHIEAEDKPGNLKIWFLGESFISEIKNNKYSKIISNFDMGEITYLDYPRFFPNFSGLYFFGTIRNLFIYDETSKTIKNLTKQKNSVFTSINSIIKDKEDNLWITSHRGIFKIRFPEFKNLYAHNGLYRDEVTAITKIGSTMLFGHDEGITFYNNDKIEIKNFTNRRKLQADFRVMQFTKDREGNVWFAAAKKGLGRIDKNHNIRWYSLPKEEFMNVVSVAADKNGRIYVATHSNIYKYANNSFVKLNIGPLANSRDIRLVYISENNELLVGNMSLGLNKIIEGQENKRYISSVYPLANSVYSVYSDKDNLLVGTSAGLFTIAGDSLRKNEKIRIDRPVYFIGKEKDNLWFGTDFGVVKWHNGKQNNFTPHENLSGLETNRGAFYLDEKGNVWIGTDKGVSEYLNRQKGSIPVKPGVIVSCSGSDGKIHSLNQNVELPYSDNELLISVNVISYLSEDLNTYIAKLENFDNNWLSEIKNSEKLRYTNLPPGKYYLRIKGKNAFGVLSNEYISAEIVILSPFYYRWWFITLVITALIGLIYFISNYLSGRKYTARLKKTVEERTFQLQESEEKYKNLVNNIQDGVFVMQNNIVKYVNKSMADMLGYTTIELLGTEWSKYIYEDDICMLTDIYWKKINGEDINLHVEFRMNHKNGNILNVISNASLINYEEDTALFGTIKDITEQKAKEAQLVKLFTAVQQSPSSVIITDPSGLIEYVNPVFELITGYSSEEIIGRKTNVFKSGLMPAEVYQDLWSTISSGNIWRGELLNQGKDGNTFWVSASIAPIKNTNGVITDYIGVEDDITFAKYARQEIERKEKLLTTTLDNVPVIIFVLNSIGCIDFIKGNGLDLLGYSDQQQLIGRPVGDLFGGDKESRNDLANVKVNKPFTTLKFVKDLVFEVHYSYFNDNSLASRGTIGLAINITDYYNAEKTIKESEAKIRAILKAIPDYIIEVNSLKTIISFHQPQEAVFKFQAQDFVGKSMSTALPNTFSKVELIVDKVFATGESQTSVYSTIKDDEERFFEARFVLKDEEKILVMVRDITEKMIAENELIKAKEVAERSDKLKSEFLAHMSHEIRSPVNTIMNYANLIEDELTEKLSDELKDGFKVINDGGMRLIRTIDLILNMSQMQTNSYVPNYHHLDLDKQVLSSIIPEFYYRAKKKGLELIYNTNSVTSLVYADDYTVGQIFANLIDNALKYTKQGKIEITIHQNNNKLEVEVMDTGIGISSEYLPNLFAPFTQEEMGYTRRFDGTGLGLALVKKYVEINNAEIFVVSEKDKGAKFIVQFPLSSEANYSY